MKKIDDKLIGNWRFVKSIRIDTSHSVALHHCHIRKMSGDNYVMFLTIDSSDKALPDYGLLTTGFYKDLKLLSIEACNIYQEKVPNNQSVFAYYFYVFSKDTLIVSEINADLISKIDSSKPREFKSLLLFKNRPEFSADKYYYLLDGE
jgi:hypothetical protein